MRVFFLLSDDGLLKPVMLRTILTRWEGDVLGVGEVPARHRGGRVGRLRGLLGFWGISALGVLARAALARRVAAFFLPLAFRAPLSLREVCGQFGVPFEVTPDVNDPSFVKRVEATGVDVLVSFQPQIFKQPLLAAPRLAAVNCHPADLPKYRGVKPIFWAMLEGDQEVGVTVHTMTADIDAGRVVFQTRFARRLGDTLLENYVRAHEVAGEAIVEALRRLEGLGREDLEALRRIPASAPYYRAPSPADVASFRRAGLRMA